MNQRIINGMSSSSALLVRWCDGARNALREVIGHAGMGQSIERALGDWRLIARPMRSDCLGGCSHLGDQVLSRLVEAFEGAERAIDLVGAAWAKGALEIHNAGIRPEAVREVALRAIDKLEGLSPILDPRPATDPITITVACKWFKVSRKTLLRAVEKGKLKNCRPAGDPPNSPFLLDPDEIERHFPPK